MKRVEDNLGSINNAKVLFSAPGVGSFVIMLSNVLVSFFCLQSRAVHNSVMELRNICNHPYLSQLHAEEVIIFILCGIIYRNVMNRWFAHYGQS